MNQNQFLVDPHIALARTNDSSISRAINTQLLTEQNGQSIENVNSFETYDNEDDYKIEENIDGTAASDGAVGVSDAVCANGGEGEITTSSTAWLTQSWIDVLFE